MKKIMIIMMIMGFGHLFAQNSYLTLNDMPPNQVYTESEIKNVIKSNDIKSLLYDDAIYSLTFYRYKQEPTEFKYPKKDKSLYRMLIKYESIKSGETTFFVTDTKMDWVYQNVLYGTVVGKNQKGNYVVFYTSVSEKKWIMVEIPKEQKFVCGFSDATNFLYFDGNSKRIYTIKYSSKENNLVSDTVFNFDNPYMYRLPESSIITPTPCIREVDEKGVPTSCEYWKIEYGVLITKCQDNLAEKKKSIVEKQLTWSSLIPGQIYDAREINDLLDTSNDIIRFFPKEFNGYTLYHLTTIEEPAYDFPKHHEQSHRYLILALGKNGFNGVCSDPVLPVVMANDLNAVLVSYNADHNKSIYSINMTELFQIWYECPLGENSFSDCILVGTDLFFWDEKSKNIKVYNTGTKEILEIKGGNVIKANPCFYETEEGVFIRQVDAEQNPISNKYYQLISSNGKYSIKQKND